MKRHGILHPELSAIIAAMGHGQVIGLADAGLPIPAQVQRIDLAVVRGVPGWLDVLTALAGDLVVEGYTLATESRAACPEFVTALNVTFPGVEATWVSHEELKQLSGDARAIVRSGSVTAYTNVLLRSGVDFD